MLTACGCADTASWGQCHQQVKSINFQSLTAPAVVQVPAAVKLAVDTVLVKRVGLDAELALGKVRHSNRIPDAASGCGAVRGETLGWLRAGISGAWQARRSIKHARQLAC